MLTVMLALVMQAAPMSGRMAAMERPQVACPAVPASLPPALAGFTEAAPAAAGTNADGAATLAIGHGVLAALLPADGVRFAVRPGKAETGASGGVFAFMVPAAGRYRVALGAPAWIDVVRDGRFVTSAAHAHGPDCTAVKKTVDFDLAPGRYLLQVSASAAPRLAMMVARLP